jgi:hypothetical protein
MTLILALLREDHIIFASDSRHVRGNPEGRYRDDDAWKVQPILNNTAMLGFSGHDHGEYIVSSLKRGGRLENGPLRIIADAIREEAEKISGKALRCGSGPNLQFLLAGFEESMTVKVAHTFTLGGDYLLPLPRSYDSNPKCDNFEIIGTQPHGALYVFRKCARDVRDLDSELRLACFALTEVAKYEIRVGGHPQIYIIRPDQQVEDRSSSLQSYISWSEEAGEKIRQLILSPSQP